MLATTCVLALALASPSLAAGDLREVEVERASFLVGNGQDKVAIGDRRSRSLLLINTLRGTRRTLSMPAGCGVNFFTQRVFARDRLLLTCADGSYVLDLRSGRATLLPELLPDVTYPVQWFYLGRHWARGFIEAGCHDECGVYLDLDSGEHVIGMPGDGPRDLDDPALPLLDGCAKPGVHQDLSTRIFDDPFRLEFRHAPRDGNAQIFVRRCGAASRRERLSDVLCVRPRRLWSCQSGSRSSKWILSAASPLVQALTERHLVSARSIAR